MFKWLKDWCQECAQHNTDLHFKCDVPMPEVKPCKNSNISEPVYALIRAWEENPKRFNLSYGIDPDFINNYNSAQQPITSIAVTDKKTSEVFGFGVVLDSPAWRDSSFWPEIYPYFGEHRLYPILGFRLMLKPSWITQDEVEYLIKTVTPYYLKRVNRYRDIVESRMDRSRKASELKSEIAKQKERDRLCEIYK